MAFDLLVCTDEDREGARQLASRIDGFNGERRGFEQTMFQEACAQIDKAGEEDLQAVVAWDAGCVTGATKGQRWHLGVAGIVASRLLEHYHVPAAVAVGETGSVRAPDGYNVHDALAAASEHLVRFGGHAAAGGFTVKPGAFEAFRAAFTTACAKQRKGQALDAGARDFGGWLEPGDLTPGL